MTSTTRSRRPTRSAIRSLSRAPTPSSATAPISEECAWTSPTRSSCVMRSTGCVGISPSTPRRSRSRRWRPPGVPMVVRSVEDPSLRPVVSLSVAGDATDLLDDIAYAIPPFSESAAAKLVDTPATAVKLRGTRGLPPADRTALADLVVRIGLLAEDLPRSPPSSCTRCWSRRTARPWSGRGRGWPRRPTAPTVHGVPCPARQAPEPHDDAAGRGTMSG